METHCNKGTTAADSPINLKYIKIDIDIILQVDYNHIVNKVQHTRRNVMDMPNIWWLPGGEELEQNWDDVPQEYEIIPDDDLPFN